MITKWDIIENCEDGKWEVSLRQNENEQAILKEANWEKQPILLFLFLFSICCETLSELLNILDLIKMGW